MCGVEVAAVASESVDGHAFGGTGNQFHALPEHGVSRGTYQFGEMRETFKICFFCAVDVEVVRIGGVDDCYVRCQSVE